ncbi:hypothetical protein Vi05172_g1206 [Venturia inaequalis]|nr:hypothetical protein Vi05172_g1206 [Venturia inaequalis]
METGAAVAGVVSTFETGANLVQQIRKRSKKKKGEQAIKEKLLQEALESGERQISELYSRHLNESGTGIQIGDAVSRERLQHIAVTMQSELIRSLQLALKFDNAKLDLTKLQEDAVMSKRNTMSVLDELRSRVQQPTSPQSSSISQFSSRAMPPEDFFPQELHQFPPLQMQYSAQQLFPPQNPTSQWNRALPPRPSIDSMSMSFRSFASSIRKPSTTSTLPSSAEGSNSRGGSGLSRFLSARRNAHKRASSSSSMASSTFATNLMPRQETPMPGQLRELKVEDPQYELPAAGIERPLLDYKIPVPEPETRFHPAMNRDGEASESNSASSQISAPSDMSDEKDSVVSVDYYQDSVRPPRSPHPVDIAFALPPSHSQLYSSAYASQLQPMRSPASSISTASMLPSSIAFDAGRDSSDISPRTYPSLGPSRNNDDPNQRTYPRPMSAKTTAASIHSTFSTVYVPSSQFRYPNDSTVTVKGSPRLLTGRPDRHNNYWGFCKGAWTVRSEWRKGLSTYEVPTGMYNSKTVWKCKYCSFEGDVFGARKPYDIDQKVYQAGSSGVQYRWLFLAKSHMKRKSVLPSMATPFTRGNQVEERCYGCVFCVGEGKETAVYADVEALCEHLINEHGTGSGRGVSEKLMVENNCIAGRKAGSKEIFDVNIPHVVEIA